MTGVLVGPGDAVAAAAGLARGQVVGLGFVGDDIVRRQVQKGSVEITDWQRDPAAVVEAGLAGEIVPDRGGPHDGVPAL